MCIGRSNFLCRAADAMAVERFVGAAPVLNERKVAPTARYPGRKGKCVNTSIAAPQTSSQPLPRVFSPSCALAEHMRLTSGVVARGGRGGNCPPYGALK